MGQVIIIICFDVDLQMSCFVLLQLSSLKPPLKVTRQMAPQSYWVTHLTFFCLWNVSFLTWIRVRIHKFAELVKWFSQAWQCIVFDSCLVFSFETRMRQFNFPKGIFSSASNYLYAHWQSEPFPPEACMLAINSLSNLFILLRFNSEMLAFLALVHVYCLVNLLWWHFPLNWHVIPHVGVLVNF